MGTRKVDAGQVPRYETPYCPVNLVVFANEYSTSKDSNIVHLSV